MNSFTFPDTGVTVSIRKVSPLLISEIQRKNPTPKPPLNKVMYGDDTRYEENPADPDYIKALEDHGTKLEQAIRRALIRFGVVYELTAEDVRRVNELREFWQTDEGEQLVGSDMEVFISYLAIGTFEDLNDLVEAVTRRSQPTEKAVAEAAERFPG